MAVLKFAVIFIPRFVAFLHQLVNVVVRNYGQFRQIFDVRTQKWMFPNSGNVQDFELELGWVLAGVIILEDKIIYISIYFKYGRVK